jgi:hypothetical protein
LVESPNSPSGRFVVKGSPLGPHTDTLLEQTARELAAQLGREPTAAELAVATGMSVEQVVEARLLGCRPTMPSRVGSRRAADPT